MAVINTSYNGIAVFNPTTGVDGVLVESTGGEVSFPLKTDGKYMFVATLYGTTAAAADLHFNVLAGQSSMGAWQGGDVHLHALASTRDMSDNPYESTGTGGRPYHVAFGPFESARVARAATSTDNDIEAVGDPCVRIDFVAVSATEDDSVFPSSTIDARVASAEIKLFKLPEIEYTT